ncbi:MAG TPA: aspartate aminotransferase family protein [Verrucomicrobiae bacterium]|nr:aspartate aminotransferase family protein [Verrucomicrobiae bacterium]
MNNRAILNLLRRYESRNVTFLDPDGSWPIVWERAKGVHVWDAQRRRYLDLTAGFGVAAAGHANPNVVNAGRKQMGRLLHAMGDVHPHAGKARLARELSRITFERWGRDASPARQNPRSTAAAAGKVIFCNSGFEAVEAALKTAALLTGKPGVIAFEGAYHGLGYGSLNATHRHHFRGPFLSQLRNFGHFVPFPGSACAQPAGPSLKSIEAQIEKLFQTKKIGAVLVEPVQVRGGIHVPPTEFLPMLRHLSRNHDAVLILDEIYTGFGRTGKWFACEHSKVIPDLICLGKALTGGFPLSACVGRSDLMDRAWPASTGEAIHTSTFLGHPVGCAMALAQIDEIRRLGLVERSASAGAYLLKLLQSQFAVPVRGLGLLAGLELRSPDGSPAGPRCMRAIKSMLHQGFILLPEGEHGNVISFTPPLTISKPQLQSAVKALAQALSRNYSKKTSITTDEHP